MIKTKPTTSTGETPSIDALSCVIAFYSKALPDAFVWSRIEQEHRREGLHFTLTIFVSKDRHSQETSIPIASAEGSTPDMAALDLLVGSKNNYEVQGAIFDASANLKVYMRTDGNNVQTMWMQ